MTEETKKRKILLVEDDDFMIELITGELNAAGFETAIAKSGKEGVQKFKEFQPELILLDLILPDMNGLDALREIRRAQKGPETKVIVLSNISEAKDIEAAKLLGVADYLVKANFSLPEVIEKVKSRLGE